MTDAPNPFWDFSLELYGRPGVAAACLELQDTVGADVNLVLFLLWCASTGRPLDEHEVAAADASVAGWRAHVIEPLRTVRRGMKAAALLGQIGTEELRDRVKCIELEAERLAQDALQAIAPPPLGVPAAMTASTYLSIYARRLGRPLPESALRTLVTAVTLTPRASA